MMIIGLSVLLCVATASASSEVAERDAYRSQMITAADLRANASLEAFHQVRLASITSKKDIRERYLLSIGAFVKAEDLVSKMIELGLDIEELQFAIGEEVYSLPYDRFDPEAIVKFTVEANAFVAQRRAEIVKQLNQSTLREERHWIEQSLKHIDLYEKRMLASQYSLVSGVTCAATSGQIAELDAQLFAKFRAIERLGDGVRKMSIPFEFYEGPDR